MHVILSEAAQRAAKSKNLRIFEPSVQIFGAKILRLASLAQDDKTGGLPDKHQFDLFFQQNTGVETRPRYPF